MKVYNVARSTTLLQQAFETNYTRLVNFLGFAKGFLVRKNPIKAFAKEFAEMIKDFLTMNKKLKMARYRLNYHRYQLDRMENLIAENNEHSFLKGKNINEVR